MNSQIRKAKAVTASTVEGLLARIDDVERKLDIAVTALQQYAIHNMGTNYALDTLDRIKD